MMWKAHAGALAGSLKKRSIGCLELLPDHYKSKCGSAADLLIVETELGESAALISHAVSDVISAFL